MMESAGLSTNVAAARCDCCTPSLVVEISPLQVRRTTSSANANDGSPNARAKRAYERATMDIPSCFSGQSGASRDCVLTLSPNAARAVERRMRRFVCTASVMSLISTQLDPEGMRAVNARRCDRRRMARAFRLAFYPKCAILSMLCTRQKRFHCVLTFARPLSVKRRMPLW